MKPILFLFLAATWIQPGTLFGQDSVSTSRKILSSLALVVSPQGKGLSSVGTAFCFWSTSSKSYFLTNEHVVAGGSEVFLQLEFFRNSAEYSRKLFKGRLYPRLVGETMDLAVIVVDVGNLPSVIFQSHPQPDPGQGVGIAGFPSFRLDQATKGEPVKPSVHFGRINSLPSSELFHDIEFDAQADHGNSGGPLFDERSGIIYGVVYLGIPSRTSKAVQNNLAISSMDASAFLGVRSLPIADYSPQYGITKTVPCNPFKRPSFTSLDLNGFCKLPDAVITQ